MIEVRKLPLLMGPLIDGYKYECHDPVSGGRAIVTYYGVEDTTIENIRAVAAGHFAAKARREKKALPE